MRVIVVRNQTGTECLSVRSEWWSSGRTRDRYTRARGTKIRLEDKRIYLLNIISRASRDLPQPLLIFAPLASVTKEMPSLTRTPASLVFEGKMCSSFPSIITSFGE